FVRFMITCRIPVDKGNELVKNGTLGPTIQSIMEDLKPEAAYFVDVEGARGGYIIVDMEEASQIPSLVEPLMIALGATIEVHPVMLPEDLQKAGSDFERVVQKYG
ncbi:MAG: hypothetical protein ACJ732_00350, partial [Rubrobacteraceae bacterium]